MHRSVEKKKDFQLAGKYFTLQKCSTTKFSHYTVKKKTEVKSHISVIQYENVNYQCDQDEAKTFSNFFFASSINKAMDQAFTR